MKICVFINNKSKNMIKYSKNIFIIFYKVFKKQYSNIKKIFK